MKKILTSSLIILSFLVIGCEKKTSTDTSKNTETNPSTITTETMQFKPKTGDTIATMTTNMGEIKILLYTEKAPETAKNFIELSKIGKYDGVPFHRVIDGFMIQGGDFEKKNGTGGYSYKGKGTTLKDEFGSGLTHVYGAVSMANTGYPNTGGSQFFIVQAAEGTPFLDGKHAIFGFVYEGMDTVEKIAALETDSNARPKKEAKIETVEISEY